jgi:hypothetical protein
VLGRCLLLRTYPLIFKQSLRSRLVSRHAAVLTLRQPRHLSDLYGASRGRPLDHSERSAYARIPWARSTSAMPCAKAHLEQDVVPYRPSIGTTRPRLPWLRRAQPSRRSHLPRPAGEPAAIRTQKLCPGTNMLVFPGGSRSGSCYNAYMIKRARAVSISHLRGLPLVPIGMPSSRQKGKWPVRKCEPSLRLAGT